MGAPQLTKGQRAFVTAVAQGDRAQFHRSVIEPVERLGLVAYAKDFRLVGRNAFPAAHFVLTGEGRASMGDA